MIDMQVYNGEYHARGKLWYSCFGAIFVAIIVLSLAMQNWSGVIVMFLFLGGYLFYQVLHLQRITMGIEDSFLRVGSTTRPRSSLQGFVLEMDTNTERIKNIVLVSPNSHSVYTFADDGEQIRAFLEVLQDKLPMLDSYPQSFLEQFMRKVKL